MANDLLLTDMSCTQPAEALAPIASAERWGVYEYAAGEVSGRAVYCRPFANPPEIRLQLPVRGRYRIYLGIHYGHIHNSHLAKFGGKVVDQTLWAKLTGDRAYRLIEPEYYGRGPEWFTYTDVTEVLWRTADLDGQALHIAPRRSPRSPGDAAGLAWVRLVKAPEQEPVAADTARLLYISDCDLHEAYPTSQEAVHTLLDPLAGSDFSHVLWQTCMGDVCYFPTERFPRAFAIDGTQSPYGYPPEPPDEGFDVLGTICEVCHGMGLKVHATMRPAASRMPPMHWPRAEGDLFHRCPEVRQLGRQGEPVGHYSFAHPLVRETFTEVFREQVLRYPLDGVHVLFNRGWPFVGYEEHVVKSFEQEHGIDPHELEDTDPRFLSHKARYMNEFLHELRNMLDEVGAQTGRELALSVTVMAGLEQCAYLGLNVAHWLSQGWLRAIVIHPCWLPNRWQDPDVAGSMSVTPQRVAEVKALAGPAGCAVYPDVYPRYMAPTDYPKRAAEYYAAGADGLCFWDTYCRVPRLSEWNTIRRLGHVEGLGRLQEEAAGFRRALPLTEAAGMSMDPMHTPATNG